MFRVEKSTFIYVAGVVLLFDLVKNTFQCYLQKSAKKKKKKAAAMPGTDKPKASLY